MHRAAEAIAPEMGSRPGTRHMVERAKALLGQEENGSGNVVGRGDESRYWHLICQEYLAARAIRPGSRLRI